jgi:hypothetical protein
MTTTLAILPSVMYDTTMSKKNPAAQALGRLGGKARATALSEAELSEIGTLGGQARRKKLTAEERSAIARKAVQARIAKYGQKQRKEGKA